MLIDKIVGGSIPREFIARSKRESARLGKRILAGFTMVERRRGSDRRSSPDVDSSEMAFKIAGPWRSRKACHRALAWFSQPIMKVKSWSGQEYMPNVFGELTARRSATSTENRAGSKRHSREVRSSRCRYAPECRSARRAAHVHHAFFTLCRSAGFDSRGVIEKANRQGASTSGFAGGSCKKFCSKAIEDID